MRNRAFFFACAALWLTHAGPHKSDVIQTPRMTSVSSFSINEVAVVKIEILPKEAQEQVYAAVIRMGDDQIRALRQSIKSLPSAAAVLHANDLPSSDVLAAVINKDGQLLLIAAVVI
ncbi:MAG: hypothetical protein JO216_10545 [Hyphomicrobiales bacterium]|nr:hypothetical protein [Hyphomicrobiales bacterium]